MSPYAFLKKNIRGNHPLADQKKNAVRFPIKPLSCLPAGFAHLAFRVTSLFFNESKTDPWVCQHPAKGPADDFINVKTSVVGLQ